MTYNNNNNVNNANYSFNPSIGAPGSGFASRGKGGHIKRLSVAPPNKISPIFEHQLNSAQLPRTARSHLLAGLRTAPKTPAGVPASAPYHQTQHRAGFDAPYYAMNNNNNNNHHHNANSNARFGYDVPQTANAPGFGNVYGQQQFDLNGQAGFQGYASPEQLFAAHQALNLGYTDYDQFDNQFYDELLQTNMYLAQRKQQLQQQLMNVTVAAQQQLQNLNLNSGSPPTPISPQATGYAQQQQQPLYGNQGQYSGIESTHTGFTPVHRSASRSPPKAAEAVATPVSATASGNTPQSPGYRRAGEHPVRQPRGPPPMEELTAKPTAKFEGTKNFAARQRRRAVHSLVRAGMERRSVLGGGLVEEFAY